jgi:hypothetical protein
MVDREGLAYRGDLNGAHLPGKQVPYMGSKRSEGEAPIAFGHALNQGPCDDSEPGGMNLKVEVEQLVRWLHDSGETEASQLSRGCSLNWMWVSLLSELGGVRDWDLWDVNIEASAPTLRRVRGDGAAIGKTIEAALRELAEASGSASVREAVGFPDRRLRPSRRKLPRSQGMRSSIG